MPLAKITYGPEVTSRRVLGWPKPGRSGWSTSSRLAPTGHFHGNSDEVKLRDLLMIQEGPTVLVASAPSVDISAPETVDPLPFSNQDESLRSTLMALDGRSLEQLICSVLKDLNFKVVLSNSGKDGGHPYRSHYSYSDTLTRTAQTKGLRSKAREFGICQDTLYKYPPRQQPTKTKSVGGLLLLRAS
jgi:hypothetical protein